MQKVKIILPQWCCLYHRGTRCLATVTSESGFKARVIVSGYSGICYEIKFSGRHRWFDGVLFNL